MNNFGEKVSFIWSVADLLRGPYRPSEYGKVMLPLTVLRRLDCVLEPTKPKVLAKIQQLKGGAVKNVEPILNRVAGQAFHNTSRLDFQKLKGEPDKIAANLTRYIKGFSTRAREIIDHFGFEEHIARLDKANRLYLVVSRFCDIDLHPGVVPNIEMGYIFEELIRKFSEQANEEAGDHFTPREVIRLMVNLLFEPDADILTKKGIVRTMLDPACGTGGMLSVADEYLEELNPDARLEMFGQDYNAESFAICCSDMMIKGQNPNNIRFDDSFTADGFPHERFDYMLANPPFGVEWKPEEEAIRKEHETQGFSGRFGAGLPRINDGSFLFLQHMISKMRPPQKGGSRIGIVFNGSPLFTGDAGSGESEIRRWIIENDWLDAIIAMPDQLFYNTGIFTYLWIVTNRKAARRRGKVQLINAVSFYQKMRKSLGNKRNELSDEHIAEITRVYGRFKDNETTTILVDGKEEEIVVSKVFDNDDFGFRKIRVERPLRLSFQVTPERVERLKAEKAFASLATTKKKTKKEREAEIEAGRKIQETILLALSEIDGKRVWKNREPFRKVLYDSLLGCGLKVPPSFWRMLLAVFSERDETADICHDADGNPEPDPELRDYEQVPLNEDIHTYFDREVKPHVPDAWIDEDATKIGYEIPLNRHFYKYVPPRPLEEIERDIKAIEKDIMKMLAEVTG